MTTTPAPVRLSVGHPARPALVGIGALSVFVVALEIALITDGGGPYLGLRVAYAALGAVYTAAGLTAWWRRPKSRMGVIIVAASVGWMLSVLGNTDHPVLACVGVVTATVPLAMVVHLLLAFPSGRLRSRLARLTVVAGFVVALVLQVPLYLFRPSNSPDGWLALTDSEAAHRAGEWVQNGCGLAAMGVTAYILGVRLYRAGRSQRRGLGPLYAYGMIAVLGVAIQPYVIMPLFHLMPPEAFTVQMVLLGAVPIVFAVGVLLGGFARTGEIHELGSWLADAPVQVHGEAVVEISYDPVRNEDPGLVQATGRVVALAIEQERLTSELRTSEHALQVAGRRIVEAGDRERNRIAQDLHDGMQAQLVAIALGAQQIARHADSTPEIQATATRLRVAIDMSARELRGLVHDILPAALIERGLADAVEDLTDRIDLPIVLDTGELTHVMSATAQRTGYFVVAECLTNAARHARATKVLVQLRQISSVPQDPLTGLQALADQVKAAGITRIDGDVAVDDRLFSSYRVPNQQLLITPTMLNEDMIDVTVTPTTPGQPAKIDYRPKTPGFAVTGTVMTTAAGTEPTVAIPDGTTPAGTSVTGVVDCVGTPGCSGTVAGTIPVDYKAPLSGRPQFVGTFRIDKPDNLARTAFIAALQRSGVTVDAPAVAADPTSGLPAVDSYRDADRLAHLAALRAAGPADPQGQPQPGGEPRAHPVRPLAGTADRDRRAGGGAYRAHRPGHPGRLVRLPDQRQRQPGQQGVTARHRRHADAHEPDPGGGDLPRRVAPARRRRATCTARPARRSRRASSSPRTWPATSTPGAATPSRTRSSSTTSARSPAWTT